MEDVDPQLDDQSDHRLDDRFGALLDRVPALTGRPRQIAELPGGLTNRNLEVTVPQGRYVARVSGANAEALGIDRAAEVDNTRAAAAAGVGAPYVDHLTEPSVLVIEYLDGRTLTESDFTDPAVLGRAASAVRRLHDGPAFTGVFDMFERQAGYLRTATEGGFDLPPGYRDHQSTFERIRDALAVNAEPLVPCNNDLLAGNFIDDGERISLIDYEYAGMNDACFELGNIAGECLFDQPMLEALITTYSGEPRPDRVARARLQCAVGQYGWTLWGCIQAAVSPLDFDFTGWAVERYEKAVALFTGTDLEALLAEVAR